MKRKLPFLCFIILSVFAFSQENVLPPEPCGLIPYLLCDENEDGIEVFNLVDFYPFAFCGTGTTGITVDDYSLQHFILLKKMQKMR